jgi:hydrogenase-4 component F
MLTVLLFAVPLALAVMAAVVHSPSKRAQLVPLGGALHLGLVGYITISHADTRTLDGWLQLDALGRLVLPLVSILFFTCSLYLRSYLALRPNRPNRLFCASLLLFLAMMTLITESQHLGLMWVALEATTLASAPLLIFDRNPRAAEATWKYIMIGGVGIALALLGSFFLAYAQLASGHASLLFADLVRFAPQMSRPWLEVAFVLLFVGYGTKMGLAPMHSWKPDAYGEAPGLVGALLAGGLTSCAFLALLRFYHVNDAAGEGEFARQLMIIIGLVSIAVGAAFMIRQRDIKRMLAYSSVEHMGILVLGIGVGGLATYGALLHLIANALTKGVLFLTAANLHRAYGSKSIDTVRGALRKVPVSGALFLAGFFAATASPPFAPFISELTIIRGMFETGSYAIAATFLTLLFVVFLGMGHTVLTAVQGTPPQDLPETGYRETFGTIGPALLLLAIVVLLGFYLPPDLDTMIRDAAAVVSTP